MTTPRGRFAAISCQRRGTSRPPAFSSSFCFLSFFSFCFFPLGLCSSLSLRSLNLAYSIEALSAFFVQKMCCRSTGAGGGWVLEVSSAPPPLWRSCFSPPPLRLLPLALDQPSPHKLYWKSFEGFCQPTESFVSWVMWTFIAARHSALIN